MRKFFVIRCLAIIYMLGMMGLLYRLIYNEYYAQIHRDTVVSYEEGEEVSLSTHMKRLHEHTVNHQALHARKRALTKNL